ncbi:hypothetical protein AYJ54_44900 [Bradyrhizobium centrolobii]|uniref:Uncharacterized protein n=1 Tax=Bradyrhizobium centrolobii TaxID=1505087 RepID=A0A176YZL7_9BRAD|nr:hypothetical protein [Bradyrhizobium centrolobii]OAF12891.1 hypothetical protein AYJ54_44900 [Bradyrhizobium centrolobii]
MSISSIAGGSAVSWPSSVRQTKSASATTTQEGGSTLAPGMNADAPYDAIKVDLPNGMSIGVVSFGNAGLDSATLKTIEDFVERLASQDTSGHADRADAASDAGNDDTSGAVGLDKIHVDLPNGISFEVRHSSGGRPTDSPAVMKELTETAEELAEAFARYSPASSAAAAYAAQQVTSSSRTNQVDTQT